MTSYAPFGFEPIYLRHSSLKISVFVYIGKFSLQICLNRMWAKRFTQNVSLYVDVNIDVDVVFLLRFIFQYSNSLTVNVS
jgi:hypothetical protein